MIEAYVDGRPTPNLEAFVDVARELRSGDDVYVRLRDERSSHPGGTVDWLTLDLKYSPLRVFEFDPATSDWVQVLPREGREGEP